MIGQVAPPSPVDATAVRRLLHSHPESGFLEIETADFLWSALERLGWELRGGGDLVDVTGCPGVPDKPSLEEAMRRAGAHGVQKASLDRFGGGNTAFTAELTGHRPGPVSALRVDMDGLPVTESCSPDHHPTTAGFASSHQDVMHACGHDGHMAIALRAAAALSDRDFAGTIRLLFQPAEEGVRGAEPMVAAGLCDDVDLLVALHLGFGTPRGAVAAATELFGTSKLRAEFRGVAAHASGSPETGRSALLSAATAVLGLHALPRFASAATRVNAGALHAPGAANIVSAHAVLEAEVRAGGAAEHDDLEHRARAVIAAAAEMHGVTVDTVRTGWATSADSDENLVAAFSARAQDHGLRTVEPRALRASDDATLMMRRVQELGGSAAYLLIGSGDFGPHHSSTFDLDESVLGPTADLLVTVLRS